MTTSVALSKTCMKDTGPLATPDGEIPASGKHQTTPAVLISDYDGDQLKESRHYFDMLTLLQQIGAA